MKFLSIALIAISAQYSNASVSRSYVCRADEPNVETRTGRRPPRPIAYITVTGRHTGGNSIGAALSIPHVRQGGRFTRTLTKTISCPKEKGSQPDYSCNFKEERYRLDIPLMASSVPEQVRVVNLSSKWGVTLTCEYKNR